MSLTLVKSERPASDEKIERLIADCYLLGTALADAGDDRGAHVLNAMADLILARDPEVAKRMDMERLGRAKA